MHRAALTASSEPSEKPTHRSVWGHILDHHAVIFAVAGLVSFGVLSALYDEFYRTFNITPPDVGIGYIDTLSHSWGFIGLALAIFLAASAIFWGWVKWCPKNWPMKRQMPLAFWIVFLLVEILAMGGIANSIVTHRASIAASGRAVRSIHWGPILFLDIQAQRVQKITAIQGVSDKNSIPSGQMLYIGNSDRSYVLYRVTDKQILKLSEDRFILDTSP